MSIYDNPLAHLQEVGQAKLKVVFWDVYHSSLYSQTGEYREQEFPQALKIEYLRDFEAKDIIKKTQDEWLKLGTQQALFSPWLGLLHEIFPNIKKGDTLLLRVGENLQSEFFFNGKPIGQIADKQFGINFLSIWLNEKCSYPLLRNKLVGLNK
jgi:hypothetical protein